MAISTKNWKARKRHDVTLPSGAVVEIELPNLPLLSKTGQLPNPLIELALDMAGQKKRLTREDFEQQADVAATLVALTVKNPVLTPEEVAEIPVEDSEMVVEFALRLRDTDAVYHHIGGLEAVESFRDARGL